MFVNFQTLYHISCTRPVSTSFRPCVLRVPAKSEEIDNKGQGLWKSIVSCCGEIRILHARHWWPLMVDQVITLRSPHTHVTFSGFNGQEDTNSTLSRIHNRTNMAADQVNLQIEDIETIETGRPYAAFSNIMEQQQQQQLLPFRSLYIQISPLIQHYQE